MDIVNQYLGSDDRINFFHNLNLDQQVEIVKSLNKEQLKEIIPELSFGSAERILRELNTSWKAELFSVMPDSMLQSIYRNASLDDKNQMISVMEERQANNLKKMNDYDMSIINSSNNIIHQNNSIQQSKLNIDSAKLNRIQAREDIKMNNITIKKNIAIKKSLNRKIVRLNKLSRIGLFRKTLLKRMAERTEELQNVINEINQLGVSNSKLGADIQKYTNQIEQEKINIQNAKNSMANSRRDIKENSKKYKEQQRIISRLDKQQKRIFGRRIFNKNVFLRNSYLGQISHGKLALLDSNLDRLAIPNLDNSKKDNIQEVVENSQKNIIPHFEGDTKEWQNMVGEAIDANELFDKRNVAKKQLEDAKKAGKSEEEIQELRSNLAKLNGAFGYRIAKTNKYANNFLPKDNISDKKIDESVIQDDTIDKLDSVSKDETTIKSNKVVSINNKRESVLDSEAARKHMGNMINYSKEAAGIISADRAKYGKPGNNKNVEFVEVINIHDGHKNGDFRKIMISKESFEKYQTVLNHYMEEQKQLVELMKADKFEAVNNNKVTDAFKKINEIFKQLVDNGLELSDKHENLTFNRAHQIVAKIPNDKERIILKVVIDEVKKEVKNVKMKEQEELIQSQGKGRSKVLLNNENAAFVSVSILVMVISTLITFVGLMLLLYK